MQLISRRVTRGENIRPRPPPRKPKKKDGVKGKSGAQESPAHQDGKNLKSEENDLKGEVDWRKWGTRVAQAKDWASKSQKVLVGGSSSDVSSPKTHRFVGGKLTNSCRQKVKGKATQHVPMKHRRTLLPLAAIRAVRSTSSSMLEVANREYPAGQTSSRTTGRHQE